MSRSVRRAIFLILVAASTLSARGQQANLDYVSDGLTRDTLEMAAQPAPSPSPAPVVRTSPQDASPARGAGTTVRRKSRHGLAASQPSPLPVKLAKLLGKRRNPAESFVYWWNGWVLRNFHMKFGTVLLGTVGAQQTRT